MRLLWFYHEKNLFSLGHFQILLLRIVILFSSNQTEFNTPEYNRQLCLLALENEIFLPRKQYSFHLYQFSDYFCFAKVLGNHSWKLKSTLQGCLQSLCLAQAKGSGFGPLCKPKKITVALKQQCFCSENYTVILLHAISHGAEVNKKFSLPMVIRKCKF